MPAAVREVEEEMDTIKTYLENMFMQLPRTPEVLKAKEELLSMMEDKYNELKAEGKTENEAVGIVISEFGNLEELAAELGINAYVTGNRGQNRQAFGGNDDRYDQDRESGREYNSEGFYVTMDAATEFMEEQRKFGIRIGLGVLMCICSPILLIIFGGIGDDDINNLLSWISSGPLLTVGLGFLFLLIAAAVGIFIFSGLRMNKYECLKTEKFYLDFQTESYVREQQEEFKASFTVCLVLGVVLCILSVVPVCVVALVLPDASMSILVCVAALLLLVGVGVWLIIYAGVRNTGYKVLLQEDEYDYKKKEKSRLIEAVSSVYWPVITCIYLGYSFITGRWGSSWMIWVVAGVLYGAVEGILGGTGSRRRR